jgi:hypothetical protein
MYELQRIARNVGGEGMVSISVRRPYCLAWSWSIPTPEVIEALAAYSPIAEVAAGTGYWARLLSEAGADVDATDANPPGTDRYHVVGGEVVEVWHSCERPHYPVREADAVTVAAEAADRTLMISWPEYGEQWGADAVRAYAEAGGQRVIYVGELDGSCGTPEFFALLGEPCGGCLDNETCTDPVDCCWCRPHACHIEPLFRRVERFEIPRWPGMHDAVFVYERA